MATWKGTVNKAFSPEDFLVYAKGLAWVQWRPQFIVLHNTFIPSLAQRPNGFGIEDMYVFVDYYKNQQKWSAGPHLFIDDKQIWVFTPLTVPGVHSPSYNSISLGVEMLGDYSKEDFDSGRGLLVQRNATSAIASLCIAIGLDPTTLKLHKEDPNTSHKDCPGRSVDKEDFIASVQTRIFEEAFGDHSELRLKNSFV
jgi:N-acetylmuramoyl-L-alanine amidase CwlA